MFLFHASPYVFLYGKINKYQYLENTKRLAPTERAQGKE